MRRYFRHLFGCPRTFLEKTVVDGCVAYRCITCARLFQTERNAGWPQDSQFQSVNRDPLTRDRPRTGIERFGGAPRPALPIDEPITDEVLWAEAPAWADRDAAAIGR